MEVNEQAFDFDSEMGAWDKSAFDSFLVKFDSYLKTDLDMDISMIV